MVWVWELGFFLAALVALFSDVCTNFAPLGLRKKKKKLYCMSRMPCLYIYIWWAKVSLRNSRPFSCARTCWMPLTFTCLELNAPNANIYVFSSGNWVVHHNMWAFSKIPNPKPLLKQDMTNTFPLFNKPGPENWFSWI